MAHRREEQHTMKAQRIPWIPAAMMLAGCAFGFGAAWCVRSRPCNATAGESIVSSTDGGGLAIIKKVLEVHGRMDLILTLAYEQLPLDRGVFHIQDDWDAKNPQFVSLIQFSSTFSWHNYPKWKNGEELRVYFSGPGGSDRYQYLLFELSDQEFDDFMTDPFDPAAKRFRYAMSPYTGVLLVSMGPDRDADLDITKFDLRQENYGLGPDFVDDIYDPTNGIVSNGDIVVSGGNGPCRETNGSIYYGKYCDLVQPKTRE